MLLVGCVKLTQTDNQGTLNIIRDKRDFESAQGYQRVSEIVSEQGVILQV